MSANNVIHLAEAKKLTDTEAYCYGALQERRSIVDWHLRMEEYHILEAGRYAKGTTMFYLHMRKAHFHEECASTLEPGNQLDKKPDSV